MKKWLVLFAGIICVSFSGIFVRLADVHGFVSAFYRIFFALVLVAPIYAIRNRTIDRSLVFSCLAGGFIFGIELALWNISVVLLNATVPTLLVNFSCIWIGLVAFFILKENLNITHWIGTAMSIFGVMIIVGLFEIFNLRVEKGVALSLLCSILISIYTLIVKKSRAKMDSISVLFYTLSGSILALGLWAVFGKVDIWPKSKVSWYYLAGLGIVVQGAGYICINYALGYMSSAKVTLAVLLQPVFTGILAMVLLGERLSKNQLAGGLIVLAGLIVSFLRIGSPRSPKDNKRKRQQTAEGGQI